MSNAPGGASPTHAGQLVVDCLAAQGVSRIFCIPGESYLAVLDGLYHAHIETVVARHEGGAAMMAEAHGKLTGEPGIAFVTRGPGATNAASGVHVAFQDSTPMILFIGQVATDQRDREAFQEVDYTKMYAPLAKWVAQVERADRLPEYISRAFHMAKSGRPGPVVLSLPEDVLSAAAPSAAVPLAKAQVARQAPSQDAVDRLEDELAKAERPLVILGGGAWSEQAHRDAARMAERLQVPVATSFRCQDYMDNAHPNYVGDVGIAINPALADLIKASDLIVALGPRLGEMTTSGYTLLAPPKPAQRLIHVHPDPDELGRVYAPQIAICARPSAVLEELADGAKRDARPDRTRFIEQARRSYEDWQQPIKTPGDLKFEDVIFYLNENLPDDAILTNGAGNYAGWLHRYYRFRSFRTQLAPTSGSMGYGLPAAIAAKLDLPEREVVCLAGDGCFQMVAQEFGTACEYGANVLIIIANNRQYGTIRMHQQRTYPGRPSGTALQNPDFAALARSYGGYGATLTKSADIKEVLDAARAAGVPAIIDAKVDPTALTPSSVG
ncbi:MAG: thiamine pyrophosphate-binding protein [Pseudomonadota bacterium]